MKSGDRAPILRRMKKTLPILALLFCLGCSDSTTPRVWFIAPKDGETITLPYMMKFGVENIDLVPAGDRVGDRGAGHHHVLIGMKVPAGTVIPEDEVHLHYGKAQTEGELKGLEPGKHTLTLQFADALHASYGPSLAQEITVTVEK